MNTFEVMACVVDNVSVRSACSFTDDSSSDDDDWAGAQHISSSKLLLSRLEIAQDFPPTLLNSRPWAADKRGAGLPSQEETESPGIDSVRVKEQASVGRAPGNEVFAPPPRRSKTRHSPRGEANAMVPMLRVKHMHLLDEKYLKDVDARPEGRPNAGARRMSKHDTPRNPSEVVAMAPMLRAQHMELLDQQYLKDAGVKHSSSGRDSARTSRPPSRARMSRSSSRTRSARPSSRTKGAVVQQIPTPREPATIAAVGACAAQQRPLGPKAVMPSVKGHLKLLAESATREADRCARERRLKEQFRKRPSSCMRSKSQLSRK
jgi:hypothetical protein